MKEGIPEQIDNPHFYNNHDNEGTFEDLMKQCVGGADHKKDLPKMHLWLPASATKEQIELVKRLCGKI